MPSAFLDLTADRLRELPPERTVFFFPVALLEDHGPHLPIGLDLREATRLCELTAERLEAEMAGWVGVVMPPAPLGIQGETTALVLGVRAHVLRDWLVDACRGLGRAGFRNFAAMSGHTGPRQLTAIEEAGRMLAKRDLAYWLRLLRGGSAARRAMLVSLRSGSLNPLEVRSSPLWPDPREHGGLRDTSVALALDPSKVDPRFRDLPPGNRPAPTFWSRALLRQRRQTRGYWGKPALATAEAGEQALREIVGDVFPQLRSVLMGANPNRIFRSWYSVLLPNKSFFHAWLLIIALSILLTAWAYIFVISMVSFQ